MNLGYGFNMDFDLEEEVDDDWDEDIEEEEIAVNTYLKDKEKGIELISELLQFNNSNKYFYSKLAHLDKLINYDFLNFSSKIRMDDEARLYQELISFKEKLLESKKINLLEGKIIVGLGGGFSAGKSKFINSIIGEDILPEDQTTTTCIPTYIAKGIDKRSAHTFTNNEVALDQEAIQALTHEMYNEYKLSFAQVIRNLVVQTQKFPYKNIVFLDTPGYTKSDSFKKADNTDAHIARQHLQVVDFLIWLIDCDNGTIKASDLEFIEGLDIKTPVLFVFNKADKKDETEVHKIVEKARNLIKKRGITCFAVTAYSSVNKEEYGGTYIKEYIQSINGRVSYKQVLKDELDLIFKAYDSFFEGKNQASQRDKQVLEGLIKNSYDITQLKTLCELYSYMNSEGSAYYFREKEFEKISAQMKQAVNQIMMTI